MGCRLDSFPFAYLGLPSSYRSLNKQAYLPLISKFQKRLSGWLAKQLSIAGRLVLLNNVLSSLPIYFMTVFILPKWVLKEIDKIRKQFLWHGASPNTHKISLANWEMVCKPKKKGGLGVMDLGIFNQALLLKWLWQWIEPKQRLWKTIFRITNGVEGQYPNSYFFNKILKVVHSIFNTSVIRVSGDGSNISFWMENWGLGMLCHVYPNLYTFAMNNEATLQAILQSDSIQNCFMHNLSEDAATELISLEGEVATLAVQLSQEDDGITWRWTASGIFTVKSAYKALMNKPSIKETINKVWKLKVPPRFKVFAWLMSFNKILTVDNLNRRGWSLTNRCIMCKMQSESVFHLFNECVQAKILYRLVELRMNAKIPGGLSFQGENTIKSLKKFKFTEKERSILLITQFVIWRERCNRTFREENCNLMQLVEQVETQWRYSSLMAA